MHARRLAMVAFAASLTLVGCGSNSHPGGSARATVTIRWATAPTRMMPTLAQSVRVRLVHGTTWSQTQVANRPATGNSSTLTFGSVPVGSVTATASAYPEAEAAGVAQAAGTATFTTQDGQTASVPLSLASTVATVTLDAPASVDVGAHVDLTVTAKDASGAVVLIPPVTWSVDNAADNVSLASGRQAADHGVTVNGLKWGQATVRASVEQQAGDNASAFVRTSVIRITPKIETSFVLTYPQTRNPTGIPYKGIISASGELYITWYGYSYYQYQPPLRLQRYSADGKLLAEWGNPEEYDETHSNIGPYGMLTGMDFGADGYLYCADLHYERVLRTTRSGVIVNSWPAPAPHDLAASRDGLTLYVVEQRGARVTKRTLTGEVIAQWGRDGAPGQGTLEDAWGINTDSLGNVYVRERVLSKFTSSGDFLMCNELGIGHYFERCFAVDNADNILVNKLVFDSQLRLRDDLPVLPGNIFAAAPNDAVVFVTSADIAADYNSGVPTITRVRTAVK